jgi:hypothetical protein
MILKIFIPLNDPIEHVCVCVCACVPVCVCVHVCIFLGGGGFRGRCF